MPNEYRLISIIIPVYNEKSTIGEVIESVSAVDLPLEKEIIVVDDGSSDGTVDILRSNELKIHHTYLNPVNVGKGAAVRIGLTLAKGDIILIQDADLELDPSELKQLVQPILDGDAKVVFGSRFIKKNTVPLVRHAANYFLTKTTNVIYRIRLTDMATAYKVFTKEVAAGLKLKSNRFEIDAEITAQIALRKIKICEIPISYRPRTKFEGKKIKSRDGVKALWTLAKYRFFR